MRDAAAAGFPGPCAEIMSELVGKLNGGGRVGISVEPVIAKSFAIGLVEQLLTRQASPKVCCSEASRE